MAGRRDLTTLLSDKAAKPALRRGQGMHLSTDAAGSDEESGNAQTQERGYAQSHNRINAQTEPVRVNRGYKLREDLIKACKREALEEDRHLYEVMEEALEAYLARRAAMPDRTSRGQPRKRV